MSSQTPTPTTSEHSATLRRNSNINLMNSSPVSCSQGRTRVNNRELNNALILVSSRLIGFTETVSPFRKASQAGFLSIQYELNN